MSIHLPKLLLSGCCLLAVAPVYAQGTLADYERAVGLKKKYEAAALNIADSAHWLDANRFWYRRSVAGGNEFVIADVGGATTTPAFDHAKLAEALSNVGRESYKAGTLPFSTFDFADKETAIEVNVEELRWKCTLSDYQCTKIGISTDPRHRPWPPRRDRETEQQKITPSPDGKQEALIRNYNVYVRQKGDTDGVMLSTDGSEGDYYDARSIAWSPDSKRLAAYRVRPGYRRKVNYVVSSPPDQLQPKFFSIEYAKPGDAVDLQQPVLFIIAEKKQIDIDDALFPNPYQLSKIEWWKDSRAFTFEYNQRGHQSYRVIEADAQTGRTRAMIDEVAKTFFCYSGKKYRHDVNDGREIVWMSERDGWNHLYLYDGATGKVKNQITKGEWVVRGVDRVDDEHRAIYFQASGMYPGEDPYFVNYYRINFDGTGLTRLTPGEGNHSVAFSPDDKYYVDTWSRVDIAPVSELRRIADQSLVREVEHGNIEGLQKAGWRPPEVFVAKGRDGKTDIWGVIYRPTSFDPTKKYPVVENIYAGPQSSFVPKTFSAYNQMQSMAELGFVVVQIDGMGTSNRSKAFHDVCWKNLADAGLPDRILWHKAVAAKYPWYDISRVGIYGTSAGGQSAMGALLFHPEFYKAAVASCGCHDNRMDKIWWNEQWMGWPVGPEYAACSNTVNASKLKGDLMLFVAETDTNVDPSSTMQVVNALIKANKSFDLLVIPNSNHTNGGAYGDRKRFDFFVHHLLGVEPPNWNEHELVADLIDGLLARDPAQDVDEAASFFEESQP